MSLSDLLFTSRNINHIVFIVLIYALYPLDLVSQTIPYIHYSLADGLPSSEIYSLYQDKKGFIWFTTDNGVVRFDGKEMDVFQTEDGLVDPVVFEIVPDKFDRLWFRSFSGRLAYFENERVKSFKYNDSLAKACRRYFMESLCFSDNGKILFGTANTIKVLDSVGNITHFQVNKQNQLQIRRIKENLVFASCGPQFEKIRFDDYEIQLDQKEERNPRKVCQLRWKGDTYFSAGRQIFKIIEDSAQLVFKGKGEIISLSTDRKGRLWVGYLHEQMEVYEDFTKKANLTLDFLRSKSVTGVLQDHEGGYWFSTLQDGVYYLPEIDIVNFNVDVPSKVTAVFGSDFGTYIGDDQGQIILLNSKRQIKQRAKLCNCAILSILYLPENALIWVSTSDRSFILNRSLTKIKEWGDSFSQLIRSKDNSVIAVSGENFYRFKPTGEVLKIIFNNKPHRAIYENEKYFLFFGRTGLQVLSQSGRDVKLPDFFDKIKVSVVRQLNDSILCLGTQGSGFLIVNQNNWSYREYTIRKGFNAENVYYAILDHEVMWLATEKGVAICKESDLITNDPRFSFITRKNGLVQDKVNFLTRSGDFVLAFSEKIISSIPYTFYESNEPIFYDQHFLVNNESRPIINGQKFEFIENNIQFRFRVIDFKNQNIFFRYRLSANSPWNYTKERVLNFYSLSPDDYSLEVEFSSDNFHWKNARILKFSILPPWWMDWRFQVAVLLILITFGVVFVKRRISRLKQVEAYNQTINEYRQKLINIEIETLDRDRARIARDLHDSIGCNLAAIKLSVAGLLRKYDDPHASYIDNELQASIQEIRDIIRGMTPEGFEKSGLVELVREYVKRITVGITVDVDIQSSGEEIKDGLINLSSFRIIQELLSNSLKYASAKRILIQIEYTTDLLLISYRDDGKGFDIQSVKKGSGISNIESRVRAMNAKLIFNSDGSGVSYRIEIALNKINFIKLNESQNG